MTSAKSSATDDSKDEYIMGTNDLELHRISMQHAILKDYMGTLTLAPVDFTQPGLKILDVCTANGLWLSDLSRTLPQTTPSHTFIGTDLVASFFPPPSNLPPNLTLQVQDIFNPWEASYLGSIDYVHQRLGLAAPGPASLESRVAKLVELVKPGGWIELVEADLRPHSSLGTEAALFNKVLGTFLDVGGIGALYASKLAEILEKEGLVNVQVKEFLVPYGATNKDKEMAELGVSVMVQGAKALSEGLKMMGMTSGLEDDELENWPQRLYSEVRERGTYFRMLGVWGQKKGSR